jgi:transposase-like protein
MSVELPTAGRRRGRSRRPADRPWITLESQFMASTKWVPLQGGQHHRLSVQSQAGQGCCPAVFEKAIGQNGSPETVTIDKSGSNLAALHAVNAERGTPIKIRQVKYLNNVV